MNELQLPVCALFFSVLLCVFFFSKERVKLIENKIYGIMLLSGVIDSLLVSIERLLAVSGDMSKITPLIERTLDITNKLDFATINIMTTCVFLYTLIITYKNINIKKIIKVVSVVDIIGILITFLLNVELICKEGVISVGGTAINMTYILSGFYIFSSLIITLINAKKVTIRHLPIIGIVFILLFLMLIFNINPYIVIISITLTFINYFMFFTIENPDVKMIEELTKAKDLSEKYNNDKSVFLFNMTQQVRYPLNMIEQITDQILDEDDINVIKERALNLRSEEKKISYVINGALDISTMDARKIKIVDNKYNINNLLTEISLKAEIETSKKNLEFRKNFDLGLPESLYGDAIRLKQIINCLITNSIKYTNEGYIELNVNSVVTSDVCRLIISVKDSGIGIKKEEIDKLFEEKEEDIDIKRIETKDITLDIAKKMVNLIGGTITVQTELHKGSEFTLIIDQKINKETNIDEIVDEYKKTSVKEKVLFVSDIPEERNFYKKKLANYDVTLSTGGENCLKRIRNNEEYDLIIIKHDMEKLDGIVTIDRLNKIKGFITKTIILAENKDIKKELNLNGYKYVITKDMTDNQLEKVLNEK